MWDPTNEPEPYEPTEAEIDEVMDEYYDDVVMLKNFAEQRADEFYDTHYDIAREEATRRAIERARDDAEEAAADAYRDRLDWTL